MGAYVLYRGKGSLVFSPTPPRVPRGTQRLPSFRPLHLPGGGRRDSILNLLLPGSTRRSRLLLDVRNAAATAQPSPLHKMAPTSPLPPRRRPNPPPHSWESSYWLRLFSLPLLIRQFYSSSQFYPITISSGLD